MTISAPLFGYNMSPPIEKWYSQKSSSSSSEVNKLNATIYKTPIKESANFLPSLDIFPEIPVDVTPKIGELIFLCQEGLILSCSFLDELSIEMKRVNNPIKIEEKVEHVTEIKSNINMPNRDPDDLDDQTLSCKRKKNEDTAEYLFKRFRF